MRPWFWVLLAVIAAVGIVALVVAISASNETVDQKKIANEATAKVKSEVAGLNEAVEAANEIQEESDERAEQDSKRIDRQVAEAVEGGEGELQKLKKRVASLESEAESLAGENQKLKEEVAEESAGEKELGREIKDLERRLARLEK